MAGNPYSSPQHMSMPVGELDSSDRHQRSDSFSGYLSDGHYGVHTTRKVVHGDQPASLVDPLSIHRSVLTMDSPSALSEIKPSDASDTITTAENEIEARKVYNNHMFGMKIWKSHLTSRPISKRSEIVQSLYTDVSKYKPGRGSTVSTIRVSNIIYVILCGWWLCLLYIIMAGLMFLSIIGRRYGLMCLRLSTYFFWPFGKFVHQESSAMPSSKLRSSE